MIWDARENYCDLYADGAGLHRRTGRPIHA